VHKGWKLNSNSNLKERKQKNIKRKRNKPYLGPEPRIRPTGGGIPRSAHSWTQPLHARADMWAPLVSLPCVALRPLAVRRDRSVSRYTARPRSRFTAPRDPLSGSSATRRLRNKLARTPAELAGTIAAWRCGVDRTRGNIWPRATVPWPSITLGQCPSIAIHRRRKQIALLKPPPAACL